MTRHPESESSDIPSTVLIRRLVELANAVSRRDFDEFTMSVPVQLHRDADVVLIEAARRLEQHEQIMRRLGPAAAYRENIPS